MTISQRFPNRTPHILTGLSLLIVVLALVAASIGLFWQDGGETLTKNISEAADSSKEQSS